MEFGAISRIWRVTRRICDENPVIGITAILSTIALGGNLFIPSIRESLGFRVDQVTKIAPPQPWRKESEQWQPSFKRTI